jgi:hippurate hydrolase
VKNIRFDKKTCTMIKTAVTLIAAILAISSLKAQEKSLNNRISAIAETTASELEPLYRDLHRNPELSGFEKRTSAVIAEQLRTTGFSVTENVGGYGVVGIYKNGNGPVIMVRTDMDALPVAEKTGVEFASTTVTTDASGSDVQVMHACGHDMHMSVWLGTLRTLITLKDDWKGTIMAVAQPGEEISAGAGDMISDGLFSRFPVPDYALAYHVSPDLPAGTVGYHPGAIFAGVSSATLTIYGEGGHGAMPHTTIDPIVLAARTVLALQTAVSREINPVLPAVITVGSIHGGTRPNIIPSEVTMQLTLRFFDDEVYLQIQDALHRIPRGIAISAGVPAGKMPLVEIEKQFTPPVSNNAALVERAVLSMSDILGNENLISVKPATVGEDFGRYGRTGENIPIALMWLGAANNDMWERSRSEGFTLPALHNEAFLPDYRPTLTTGVRAMARTMIDLFNREQ